MPMDIARKITNEETMMLHMLGILPRQILGLGGNPVLDNALKPGKLYKTLQHLLPQYGFTPGYPETLLARARSILAAQDAAGVVTISCFDEGYPECLKSIDDFPPLIYCLGDSTLLSCGDVTTIVGARNIDDEGSCASWRLGYEFGRRNIVLSELSAGCNAAVLRGCMDIGCGPIVVAAQGLDAILSPDIEVLRADVLDHGGVIFSEHPFGCKPSARRLVARYRLCAALSKMLIIAQAPAEHRDLFSAVRFAQYLHRPIKAWRYGVRNDINAGNFNLIGTGVASPIILK